MLFDLKEYEDKKVHFIGIGGVSMSGLAAILLNSHIRVSGSDFKESVTTERLRKEGAEIFFGHHKENITDQDIVVYTAAIKEDNEELVRARELGLQVYDRAEFLGHIIQNFVNSIAVTGTHGKTSTTSMLTSIALAGNTDPTILVGGFLPLIHGNYRIGNGDLIITEACEYKRSFLKFPGKVAVILNIEADHLDYYKDLDEILLAFKEYISLMPQDGIVVANIDDPNMNFVLKDSTIKTITFGLHGGDLRARDITYDHEGHATFKVYFMDQFIMAVTLRVPGEFNIYNALGAIGSSIASGISMEAIKRGLEEFRGVNKRFQHLYTKKGIIVIDDYAHHPGEIKNSIKTALQMDHRKVHVVFQPHTYSRTKALFDEFSEVFDALDTLVLLPVYAAREIDTGLVSSDELGDAIRSRQTVHTENFTEFAQAAHYLESIAESGDLIITMGAGEAVKVADILKTIL